MSKLKRIKRKINKGEKKFKKAKKIANASINKKGKRAGAERARAVRKYKASTKKNAKALAIHRGIKGKAKNSPAKAKSLAKSKRAGVSKSKAKLIAKSEKLAMKKLNLVGSKKRRATRGKHLDKRQSRITKKLKKK